MHPITRKAVNAYSSQIAALNGVDRISEKFNVAPSVAQTLETKIQESADVLKRINIVPVREQQGQKLGLGVGGPAASRTNTKIKDRATRDLSALDIDHHGVLDRRGAGQQLRNRIESRACDMGGAIGPIALGGAVQDVTVEG